MTSKFVCRLCIQIMTISMNCWRQKYVSRKWISNYRVPQDIMLQIPVSGAKFLINNWRIIFLNPYIRFPDISETLLNGPVVVINISLIFKIDPVSVMPKDILVHYTVLFHIQSNLILWIGFVNHVFFFIECICIYIYIYIYICTWIGAKMIRMAFVLF